MSSTDTFKGDDGAALFTIEYKDGEVTLQAQVAGPYNEHCKAHVACLWLRDNWNVVNAAVEVLMGVGTGEFPDIPGLIGVSKFEGKLEIEIDGVSFPTADCVQAAFQESGKTRGQWNALSDDERDEEVDLYLLRLQQIVRQNKEKIHAAQVRLMLADGTLAPQSNEGIKELPDAGSQELATPGVGSQG